MTEDTVSMLQDREMFKCVCAESQQLGTRLVRNGETTSTKHKGQKIKRAK